MKKVDSNKLNWSLENSGVKYMVQGPNIEWDPENEPGQSSLDYGNISIMWWRNLYFISGSPSLLSMVRTPGKTG